ncbi:hypothetical protein, partial [Enterobacter hormaechei]
VVQCVRRVARGGHRPQNPHAPALRARPRPKKSPQKLKKNKKKQKKKIYGKNKITRRPKEKTLNYGGGRLL